MPRKKPRRNITRVEIENRDGNLYGGWEVRLQRRKKKYSQFFSDLNYGGKRASLQAAKVYRDELEEENPKASVAQNARSLSTRNKSGVVGVRLHEQKDRRGDYEYHYWYWVAQWTDGHGRRKTKSFSIHQYGDDEAFRLAVQSRKEGVAKAKR
ncbi:MAG: AP2 domain-containing protein [Planctomycetota bacterium]